MADLGSDNSRHDLELGLLSEEVDVLEMIDDAIKKLDDDEFGICVDSAARSPRSASRPSPTQILHPLQSQARGEREQRPPPQPLGRLEPRCWNVSKRVLKPKGRLF
jgi:hypothetical protein